MAISNKHFRAELFLRLSMTMSKWYWLKKTVKSSPSCLQSNENYEDANATFKKDWGLDQKKQIRCVEYLTVPSIENWRILKTILTGSNTHNTVNILIYCAPKLGLGSKILLPKKVRAHQNYFHRQERTNIWIQAIEPDIIILSLSAYYTSRKGSSSSRSSPTNLFFAESLFLRNSSFLTLSGY